MRDVLDVALELGLPVFPCGETKAPACLNGFKSASAEPDKIRALWHGRHGPLIGVPTGATSGFDVLDVDRQNGGRDWYEEHRKRLPATRIHRTRSGGLHVLFRHADGLRNSAGKIAPGIDVRADGGYIIWWPAAGLNSNEHALSSLSEWPLWLLPLLMSAPIPPPPIYPKSAEVIPFAPHQILRCVKGILLKVALASPGERNALLFWGACRLREMAGEGKIALPVGNELLTEAALRTGLRELEVARTIASAQKSAVRHG